MRILGIDPGYAIVGCGVVEYDKNRFDVKFFDAIQTEASMPFTERIAFIYDQLLKVMKHFKPDALAIEQLFFNTNQKTAMNVAQARGVILLAAQQNEIPIFEYTPLQIKQAVVGYGRAEKKQVMEMTRVILRLAEVPTPDDAADALAVAICHGHNSSSLMSKANLLKKHGANF